MKKIWQSVLVLFTVLAFSGNWIFAQEIKGPKIAIQDLIHNFGDVKEGKILTHTFQVLNKGNETLKIIKVKPG
jgi:hypothetical protein